MSFTIALGRPAAHARCVSMSRAAVRFLPQTSVTPATDFLPSVHAVATCPCIFAAGMMRVRIACTKSRARSQRSTIGSELARWCAVTVTREESRHATREVVSDGDRVEAIDEEVSARPTVDRSSVVLDSLDEWLDRARRVESHERGRDPAKQRASSERMTTPRCGRDRTSHDAWTRSSFSSMNGCFPLEAAPARPTDNHRIEPHYRGARS